MRLFASLALLLALVFAALPFSPSAGAEAFASPAFEKVWNVTDKPVTDGVATRSFLWGAEGFATKTERYDDSPEGSRLVQYFDKGRMELTHPEADPNSGWYVGSGLLVRDLAGGIVQVGDNNVQVFDPALIPVAGDSSAELNKDAPTYADFGREAFGLGTRSLVGSTISVTVKAGGKKGRRDAKAEPVVKLAYYVQQTGHNIAAPFWDYFQAQTTVYSPKGMTVTSTLFDWQSVMGYPITEPYWTTVKVGGKDTETLLQLFQRRVLTYTPSNQDQFKVEMGNVGRHYYQWRYNPVLIPAIDTSVPDSVNGSVGPKYGDKNATFRLFANGFQPGEPITVSLTRPDGKVQMGSKPIPANSSGKLATLAFAGDLVSGDPSDFGVYLFTFTGTQGNNVAKLYFRIVTRPAKTPTTPYQVDRSVPTSINAVPYPAVGNPNADFAALTRGFYVKDYFNATVSLWITDSYGFVFPLSLDVIGELDETPDGMILELGPIGEAGLWTMTVQSNVDANKRSIIYWRVTDEPPEVTTGAALNATALRGTSGLLNKMQSNVTNISKLFSTPSTTSTSAEE